jgi:predicted ATPase
MCPAGRWRDQSRAIAHVRAALRYSEGHTEEAQNVLRPVYERFTEGYDAADLRQAQALLDQLA